MKKILIIRGSSIGDIVEAMPVAAALKQLYGANCSVTWLIKRKFATLVENNKNIDHVLCYEDFKDMFFRSIRLLVKRRLLEVKSPLTKKLLGLSCAQCLAKQKFDLVLDLHHSVDAQLYAVATDCDRILTASFLLASDTVYASLDHRIVENMEVIQQLESGFPVQSFLAQADWGWQVKPLSQLAGKQYIVLVLSTTWPSKNYPPAQWLKVINQLEATGFHLVLLGSKGDQPIVDLLQKGIKNKHCISLVGKTSMREMLGLLSQASLVVGGDTGPLHIAASMYVPTLTLMGPTHVGKYAPFGKLSKVLVSDYPCKCCHLEKCPKNICCMNYIKTEKVVKTIKECLQICN